MLHDDQYDFKSALETCTVKNKTIICWDHDEICSLVLDLYIIEITSSSSIYVVELL